MVTKSKATKAKAKAKESSKKVENKVLPAITLNEWYQEKDVLDWGVQIQNKPTSKNFGKLYLAYTRTTDAENAIPHFGTISKPLQEKMRASDEPLDPSEVRIYLFEDDKDDGVVLGLSNQFNIKNDAFMCGSSNDDEDDL